MKKTASPNSKPSFSLIKFIFTSVLKVFLLLAAIYTGGIADIGSPSAKDRQANDEEVKVFLQEKGWLHFIWRIAEVGVAFAFGILLFVYSFRWALAINFHDFRNIMLLPLPFLALSLGIWAYLAITERLKAFTFWRLGMDVLVILWFVLGSGLVMYRN